MPKDIYGVTGFPLGQSIGPYMHNYGFEQCSLAAEYQKFEQSTEELAGFVERELRSGNIKGLSVTMPHKQAIIPLLDSIDPLAERIGAVNTILHKGDKLYGTNFDIGGFLWPLEFVQYTDGFIFYPHPETANSSTPAAKPTALSPRATEVASKCLFERAVVLGSGGAARAILAGLEILKVPQVDVFSRNAATRVELQKIFTCNIHDWNMRNLAPQSWSKNERVLIVNTTPIGMSGKAEGLSPLTYDFWINIQSAKNILAYDIVYNPLHTAFLQAAKQAGCTCIDGLYMLVGQGLKQFNAWTEKNFDVNTVRTLLKSKLG